MSIAVARETETLMHVPHPDRESTAFFADWLAGLFMGPLDAEAIAAFQNGSASELLDAFCAAFGCEEAGARLQTAVAGPASETALALSRRFLRMFEGLAGPEMIVLYESGHVGNGLLFQEPVTRMREVLREIDMWVAPDCCEPADHLSIELSALAEALRQGRDDIVSALVQRLQNWVPGLVAKIRKTDPQGFYGAVAIILSAFLVWLADDRLYFSQGDETL